MLKNRAFLIGLGSGIILGALLFQLMLSGEQSRQKLGQFGNETAEKLYTRAEVDALLEAERLKEQPSASVKPVKEELSGGKTKETAPTEPVKEKAAAVHVIRIEAGLGIAKTAELLAGQNIIHDQAAFISHMNKSKKLVRAGYFLFQENISVDEAITVVTGQPITKAQADAITASN
ncbi:hypothetical protein [Paenibacillus sp. Soil522]|uniref:hypothetical protein n=1 Tax=Paenibacillus sp. Soil522 TaxID=1736388 RepID=UPI0007004B62|nr:hypothetical protein [Paenibacillus sp. Soil522]KRE39869.1 hypothetical protein ASG81_18270 [Paenibacillus sp. Soil522]